MKYKEEIHKLYWDTVKDIEYHYYRETIPILYEKIESYRHMLIDSNIEKDFNIFSTVKGFNQTLEQFSSYRKEEYTTLISELEHTLLFEKNRLLLSFTELNDFRKNNNLLKLVSLGSSSYEDYVN